MSDHEDEEWYRTEYDTPKPSAASDVWANCYSCRDYALHRREVIAGPLAAKARWQGRDTVEVVDEFMLAAHARHLAGQPLRPGGPTRVTDPDIGRFAAMISLGLLGDTDAR